MSQLSALIIGGTRGVGLAFAQEALKRGITPVIIAREASAELAPIEGRQIAADVSTAEGLERVLIACEAFAPTYVFWVAGSYCRGPLVEMTDEDVDRALAMHQAQMVKFIRGFHGHRLFAKKNLPGQGVYTLVVMGSISSYALRKDEAVYAMAKAGQAAFVRQFAVELHAAMPMSRTILVNSARMAKEAGVPQTDSGGLRIDPGFVAKTVWDNISGTRPYLEINITRGNGRIDADYFPQKPETL